MSLQKTVNSISTAYMLAKTMWNVYKQATGITHGIEVTTDVAYRPATWQYSDGDSATSEIFMQQASNINEILQENVEGVEGATKGTLYGWFFDAFLRESHTGSVRITDHPVQSGANISDHAYNLPDKLTLEIFVSDVMDSLVVGQFAVCETKSISAYETLRRLKRQRQPLSVRTKLHYYENMVIENMTVNDDFKSKTSLRCTVMLREIIMAQVATEVAVSAFKHVPAPKTAVKVQPRRPGGGIEAASNAYIPTN